MDETQVKETRRIVRHCGTYYNLDNYTQTHIRLNMDLDVGHIYKALVLYRIGKEHS